MARAAALGVILLALAALFFVLWSAADRLDRRFVETRFVVRPERCPLVEYQRQVFQEQCPYVPGDT